MVFFSSIQIYTLTYGWWIIEKNRRVSIKKKQNKPTILSRQDQQINVLIYVNTFDRDMSLNANNQHFKNDIDRQIPK